MPAPKPVSMGDQLRRLADQHSDRLYVLAELADTPQRSITAVQQLHDEIETTAASTAGDIRAVVRGRR